MSSSRTMAAFQIEFFAAMLNCISMRWRPWYLVDYGSITLQSVHSLVWLKMPTLWVSMPHFSPCCAVLSTKKRFNRLRNSFDIIIALLFSLYWLPGFVVAKLCSLVFKGIIRETEIIGDLLLRRKCSVQYKSITHCITWTHLLTLCQGWKGLLSI